MKSPHTQLVIEVTLLLSMSRVQPAMMKCTSWDQPQQAQCCLGMDVSTNESRIPYLWCQAM